METHKATINREENTNLEFSINGKTLKINLTEDKPKEVKNTFNELLLELKKGESRKITEKDFSVLCANCHRMIHRLDDSSDLEKLKRLIKNA